LDQHIQKEIHTMQGQLLNETKTQTMQLFEENQDHEKINPELLENKRKHIDQARRLKELSKLHQKASDEMEEMEGTPAYKRTGVKLTDVNHSSQTELTRWSLFDKDGEPMPKSNNSFLHDQVD
jgi:cell division protein FtsZ